MTLWVVLALASSGATAYDETFDRACELYRQGDYGNAAQQLERLVSEGVADSVVFYNLANSHYRNGKRGLAIANYERALLLDPNNESAEANLALCVGETERGLRRPAPPLWERVLFSWHYRVSAGVSRFLGWTAWFGFWGVLALRYWRPIRLLGLVAVLLAFGAAVGGTSAWLKAHPPELAVAGSGPIPVRYGIGDKETVRFELYEGDRVILEREEGEWARVRVSSGERGWTKLDGLIRVGPPFPRHEPVEEAGGETEKASEERNGKL